MKILRPWIAACTATLCLGGTASATTYYVATTGNDLSNGSSSAPWRTLQHAVEAIAPGDMILVRSGTYAGCRIRNSGTPAAPKTLARDVGRRGRHQHARSTEQPLEPDRDRERLRVRGHGLDHRRPGGRELAASRHRHPDHQPHHDPELLRASQRARGDGHRDLPGLLRPTRRWRTTSPPSTPSTASTRATAPTTPPSAATALHHNQSAGIHMNGDLSARCPCGTTVRDGIISFALVENNVIYENGAAGGSAINADGVDDSIFRNNLLYENHASGISLFWTDGAHGSSRNKVYNNTIVQAANGRWCVNIPGKGKGATRPATSSRTTSCTRSARTRARSRSTARRRAC